MVDNISEVEAASPRTWTLLARGLDLGPLRWAALLLVATLILRLPIFFYPFFNGDEATYSALANALLDGKWLYVDAVDHKPPLIYWTYAAVLGACGPYNIHAVHLFSVLCVSGTGLLVGATADAFGLGRTRSRLGAFAFVVLCSLGPGKDMLAANAELFMMLPTAAAMFVLVRSRCGPHDRATGKAWEELPAALAAGFLLGLAALFKYQAAAGLIPVVFLVLVSRLGSTSRKKDLLTDLLTIAVVLAGMLLPAAVLVGVWAAAGRFEPLWFWAWHYPLVYAGKLPPSRILGNLLRMTATWSVVSLGFLVASAIGFRALRKAQDERQRALGRFALAWLAGSALGVAAGGRFFLHYYLQFAAPIALLTAAATWRTVLARRVAIAYTAILIAAFWVTNALDHRVRPRIRHHTQVYAAVGEWVRLHTHNDARLFVWGNSPEIYFFAQRRMGTRFPFCNYHSGRIWGTAADDEPTGAALAQSKTGAGLTATTAKEALPEAWPMLLADLEQRRPAVIVDAASAGLDRWLGYELFRYPKLWEIVQRDYREAARVAGASIYVRTGSQ